jgi:hypothetical protein
MSNGFADHHGQPNSQGTVYSGVSLDVCGNVSMPHYTGSITVFVSSLPPIIVENQTHV